MASAAPPGPQLAPDPTIAEAATREKRTDIQGLRAIAVSLVVIYHLFPERLRGGFVGVDVFFVISGFLITSHLLVRQPRTIRDLLDFWARRIRRLLPASLTVLLATLIAVRIWEPDTRWEATAQQTAAAALYVVNWVLAQDSVDYLAAEEAPSAVQHFWSLSVEEQFYLGWPILVLVLGYLALSRPRAGTGWPRAVFLTGFSLVAAASLAWSVHLTGASPSRAYFVTTTRIWELAAGGIVAALLWRRAVGSRPGPKSAAVLAGGGLLLIAWSGVTFSDATPFPGWHAAVPVAGTALVLAVAAGPERWSPGRLLGLRPLQWLGDISYSVYLWHWPLIVILPSLTGGHLAIWEKAAIVVATLGLAALTKSLIEDGFRTPQWNRRLGLTYAMAAVGMAVVVGSSLALVAEVGSRERSAQADLLAAERSDDPCFGAGALAPGRRCEPTTAAPVPSPALAAEDRSEAYPDGDRERDCFSYLPSFPTVRCVFGDRDADRTIALVGNSHAGQWVPAFERLGKQRGWRVVSYLASRCASADVDQEFDTSADTEACRDWVRRVSERVATESPDLVVMTNRISVPAIGSGGSSGSSESLYQAGFAAVLGSWRDHGLPVLVLRDTPAPGDAGLHSIPDCLASNPDDVDACSGSRSDWIPADPAVDAARALGDQQVMTADLNDRICGPSTCEAVVGGVVVYFDGSHLTATYNRTLTAPLAAEIDRATRRAGGAGLEAAR